jgi:hypothetical protein
MGMTFPPLGRGRLEAQRPWTRSPIERFALLKAAGFCKDSIIYMCIHRYMFMTARLRRASRARVSRGRLPRLFSSALSKPRSVVCGVFEYYSKTVPRADLNFDGFQPHAAQSSHSEFFMFCISPFLQAALEVGRSHQKSQKLREIRSADCGSLSKDPLAPPQSPPPLSLFRFLSNNTE